MGLLSHKYTFLEFKFTQYNLFEKFEIKFQNSGFKYKGKL